jgi:endonuclease/exonuclease/phosphatase family metal-dependent hydrolase
MKLATLNLGLLYHFFSKVPFYYWRKDHFAPSLHETLRNHELDVVVLQELWKSEDVDLLEKEIESSYLVLRSPARWSERLGLVTLVRRDANLQLSDHRTHLFRNFLGFNERAFHERITGFLRGYLITSLRDVWGNHFKIVNTHLTPFEKNFRLRQRQLGSLSKNLKKDLQPKDILIIAGDMNHSTAYLKPKHRREALQILESFLKEWRLQDPTAQLETFVPARNSIAGGIYWGNDGKGLCLDRIWIGPRTHIDVEGEARLFADKPIGKNSDGRELHVSDHFGVELSVRLKGALQQPLLSHEAPQEHPRTY